MNESLKELLIETLEILGYTLLGLIAVIQIVIDCWAYQQILQILR